MSSGRKTSLQGFAAGLRYKTQSKGLAKRLIQKKYFINEHCSYLDYHFGKGPGVIKLQSLKL